MLYPSKLALLFQIVNAIRKIQYLVKHNTFWNIETHMISFDLSTLKCVLWRILIWLVMMMGPRTECMPLLEQN